MIRFLQSGALKPPRFVHQPPRVGASGHGLVVPSFDLGIVSLRDAKGRVVRVAWEKPAPKDGKPTRRSKRKANEQKRAGRHPIDKSRALDPGVYTLIGYRVIRYDKSGRRWFVSATASRGVQRLAVVAGRRQKISIDPAIAVDCVARRTKSGLRILMTITGEAESGLTIFRLGRRIPIGYRVLDSRGRTVASGLMEYG